MECVTQRKSKLRVVSGVISNGIRVGRIRTFSFSAKFAFDSVAHNPVKTKISSFAMETAYMYFTKEDFTN